MTVKTAYNESGGDIMANVSIQIEDNVKQQAERILSQIGLDLSSAANLFMYQVILHNGIPFSVVLPDACTAEEHEKANKTAL